MMCLTCSGVAQQNDAKPFIFYARFLPQAGVNPCFNPEDLCFDFLQSRHSHERINSII